MKTAVQIDEWQRKTFRLEEMDHGAIQDGRQNKQTSPCKTNNKLYKQTIKVDTI